MSCAAPDPGARFAPLDPRPPPEPGADGRATPEADGLQLSVAAVARKLGIAPATLRTWDRRYGIGPAEHLPSSQTRLARRRPCTTHRAALTPGSHHHAGRAGCDASEPLGNREDTPCGGRKRPLTAAGQQRWVQPRLVTKGAHGLLVDRWSCASRGAPRRRRCG